MNTHRPLPLLPRALTFQAAGLFLVSILPVLLGVGWLNYQYTTAELEDKTQLNATAATHTIELTLANALLRELERVSTLTHAPLLGASATPLIPGDRLVRQQAYVAAAPGDALRQRYVDSPAGRILRVFRDQYPNRAVVLLADTQGGLVSTTTPSWATWDLSTQPWWPNPARAGVGITTISPPVAVDKMGTLIFITSPVVDTVGQPVGVVAVGLKFADLVADLLNASHADNTTTLLVDGSGAVLYALPQWDNSHITADWYTVLSTASVAAATTSDGYLLGYAPMQLREGYALDDVRDLRMINSLNWTVLQVTPSTVAFAPLADQLRVLAAGTTTTAVVVVLMALVVVRGLVTRPLARLESVIADVRRDGVTTSVLARVHRRLPTSNNEIGRVAGAFERMVDELGRVTEQREQLYSQQQATVLNLRGAAARLSGAAAEQEQITTTTSAVLAQVLEAFAALDEATTVIFAQAAEVATQAGTLRAQHHAGEAAVSTTHQALAELQQSTQVLQEGAHTLAQSASNAGTLVDEANEIADTTQLLSLNALIESADAGQHGARFKVIADEVRTLAAAASRAAGSIEATLQQMAIQTRLTASETRQANNAANQGAQQIDILSVMMHDLLQSADGLAENAELIRRRSEAQRSRSTEVQQGSHQLASAMQQVTYASRHVAHQAQELLQLASVLEQTQ